MTAAFSAGQAQVSCKLHRPVCKAAADVIHPRTRQLVRISRQGGDPGGSFNALTKCRSAEYMHGENVRLSVQTTAHRRQRGRQDMSAVQIQRGLLQHHLHLNNR